MGRAALSGNEPLLAGMRVLDLCDGDADAVTRLLADLGADVIKVEPPGGSAARTQKPTLAGVSIPFALHNANKRTAVLDPADEADRRRFLELAAEADIVVDSGQPGAAAGYGLSCEQLADRYGHLVTMTVTGAQIDTLLEQQFDNPVLGQNRILQVLTVLTVVFLPVTFITNLFGMNVPVPFDHVGVAFFAIFAVLLGAILALLAVFKWLRWV